jgi:hypothetical protein
MRVTGGCLCRAIRFEGAQIPTSRRDRIRSFVDNQRSSNSLETAAGPVGAICITPGAREFRSTGDSGSDIVRAFCPTSGSGNYSHTMPDLIFFRASAPDDPSLFAPQLAVWASRAPTWDAVTVHLPAFAQAPINN